MPPLPSAVPHPPAKRKRPDPPRPPAACALPAPGSSHVGKHGAGPGPAPASASAPARRARGGAGSGQGRPFPAPRLRDPAPGGGLRPPTTPQAWGGRSPALRAELRSAEGRQGHAGSFWGSTLPTGILGLGAVRAWVHPLGRVRMPGAAPR